MRRILILGSTGSIGKQALEIIRNNRDRFSVAGLTCRSRIDELIEQIREFRPEAAAVGTPEDAERLRREFPQLEVYYGPKGLDEIAELECDILLNSLMGISGLSPTYTAISCGRDIALANKETLVAGGALITELCRSKGIRLLPVDSEHSAIFQCLEGNGGSACGRAYAEPENSGFRSVRRILLTASGGPFRGRSAEELRNVTVEEALNHPKWNMGSKITVDSATMMNKGLEVIEARWLFDIPGDKIEIHVHPESIIHSMVEFEDRSVIAQLGLPDMKIPIGLALNYPERLSLEGRGIDFFSEGRQLTFEKPDRDVFRCIDIAYAALREGGAAPVIMNGANEELVSMFLKGKIGFTDIPETIEKVMEACSLPSPSSVEEILEADRAARQKVKELI